MLLTECLMLLGLCLLAAGLRWLVILDQEEETEPWEPTLDELYSDGAGDA